MNEAAMIEEGTLTGVIKPDAVLKGSIKSGGVLKGSLLAPRETVTGAETFDVTITSSTDSSGNITYASSNTFDDILAAARANTQVRLITPDNKYCSLDYIPDSGAGALFFNEDPVFANDGSYVFGSYWVIYSNNKVDWSDKFMVRGLPSYSTDEDDGKILQVSATSGVDWATPAVTKIESPDQDNPKILEGLEDGAYILQGYFKLASGLSTFECNNELARIRNADDRMYVWTFDPYLNCIVRYEITDGGSITDYFNLNDLHNAFVRFDNGQLLSDKQKKQARENIGAGASNFSGSYNDLTDKPANIEIPSVTTSDNGKILQVVDGAWTAVTGSGSSGESNNVIEF